MKCSKCGKEIANDSVFCEYCGTEIKVDNANKKDNTKRVDIRWALLPTMLMATFAMFVNWNHLEEHYESAFLSKGLQAIIWPTIVFLISLFYWIKKKVPTSFFLIMVCFLYLNSSMFFDLLDPMCQYTYKTELSWHNGHKERSVELYYETWVFDESDRDTLRQDRREIIDALVNNGMDVADECYYMDASEHYYIANKFLGALAFTLTSVLFILYIIYALIAHKRGWKF